MIAEARSGVKDLEGLLGQMEVHATANGASAHAELYERVRMQIWMASEILGYALDTMSNADPEDL